MKKERKKERKHKANCSFREEFFFARKQIFTSIYVEVARL